MQKENITNNLAARIEEIKAILKVMDIEVNETVIIDPESVRLNFVYKNMPMSLVVMEEYVEHVSYYGILPPNDPRIYAFKEGANYTNYNQGLDTILWDGPDKNGHLWFIVKRVFPIASVTSFKLLRSFDFHYWLRDQWLENCNRFRTLCPSNLETRMN